MEQLGFNLSTLYLTTGSKFSIKIFDVTLDIFSMHNICQTQVNQLFNKRDIKHWKIEIWKKKSAITGSWGINFRWGQRILILQKRLNKVV